MPRYLDDLRGRIADADSLLGPSQNFGPDVTNLSNKLQLLGRLRALYVEVANIPASGRAALLKLLDAQANLLSAAAKEAELAEVAKGLAGMMVRDAQRTALAETLRRTEAMLDAPNTPAPAERNALDAERQKLREVKALLDSDQLDEAQRGLPPIRGRIVAALAQGFWESSRAVALKA